jgi:hypothetical protein
MRKSDPFRTLSAATILLVMAGAAASVALLYRSTDPVLVELKDIATDSAEPQPDARKLRQRLDMLVETHGFDYLTANRAREEAFIKADRGVQRCEMFQPITNQSRTEDPQ